MPITWLTLSIMSRWWQGWSAWWAQPSRPTFWRRDAYYREFTIIQSLKVFTITAGSPRQSPTPTAWYSHYASRSLRRTSDRRKSGKARKDHKACEAGMLGRAHRSWCFSDRWRTLEQWVLRVWRGWWPKEWGWWLGSLTLLIKYIAILDGRMQYLTKSFKEMRNGFKRPLLNI